MYLKVFKIKYVSINHCFFWGGGDQIANNPHNKEEKLGTLR